ncbi:MAG: NAD(P)H-dependent flavin oxidoreductase [Vulcanimicrobiaceae bacterium]
MNTALRELFGVEIPIVSAPMTPQAGGELARAVSEAGALGMFGFDEGESLESLREQLAILRRDGFARPFGIGLVRWVIDARPDLVELALETKPALVNISFGDPTPYVPRFHAAGIRVCAQVQSRQTATVAEAGGVDFIVAQGTEAGGHTGAVGTLPLLQIVLDTVGVPVVAAGGIATGRGLAAVLAAGAAGAWIGTPFLVASEARSNDAARARLVESDETQTVLTKVFDRIQHKPWPGEFLGRALRNEFIERWQGHEDEMLATPAAERDYIAAKTAQDYRVANIYAGQSAGMVSALDDAGSIVRRIAGDATARLEALAALFEPHVT